MEEEINYSEVTFKSSSQFPKGQKEEQAIYSEVKSKAHATEETTPAPAAVKGAVNTQHHRLLAAAFATLGVLLLVTISLLIYFVVRNNDMSAGIQGLMTEKIVSEIKTKELSRQKSILENKTEELSRQMNGLNWTIGRILMYDSFPVNDFCPNKRCQPCMDGWIQFQEKCYFFYKEGTWKTWKDSQIYCRDKAADLVAIETLQEQEFISNNIECYNGDNYGFWIGLKQGPEENWIWVNGREDTLKFWVTEDIGNTGPYALMLPGRPPTASWDPSDNAFQLRFICESELLIKPL